MSIGHASSSDPAERINPKDAVAIVRLVDLVHLSAEEPAAWSLVVAHFRETAAQLKPKYRRGIEAVVREVRRTRGVARDPEIESASDRIGDDVAIDDVYHLLGSLLPGRDNAKWSPGSDPLRMSNAVLLREIIAPFVASAMTRRLFVLRHSTPAPAALSPREREVYERIVAGDTNASIGRTLSISVETVKTHVQRIFRKLGVAGRIDLLRRNRTRNS